MPDRNEGGNIYDLVIQNHEGVIVDFESDHPFGAIAVGDIVFPNGSSDHGVKVLSISHVIVNRVRGGIGHKIVVEVEMAPGRIEDDDEGDDDRGSARRDYGGVLRQ